MYSTKLRTAFLRTAAALVTVTLLAGFMSGCIVRARPRPVYVVPVR